jgi:hypothetical protein
LIIGTIVRPLGASVVSTGPSIPGMPAIPAIDWLPALSRALPRALSVPCAATLATTSSEITTP